MENSATSLEGQKHINVSQPLAGFYKMQDVFENGCKVNIEKNLMRVLEPEFVFLLMEKNKWLTLIMLIS